jgi:anti-sigma regulatory factor (Ser/Thr protein kinase)
MPATAPAPWPLQTHLELAALPSAVSCARGHVRSVAREWGVGDLAETAELLVSELVTNAIRASDRLRIRADLAIVPVIGLWLVSDQISLVIHVWDGNGDEMPVRRDAGADDEAGRGLMLVDALASERGAYRKAAGKVVWVKIDSLARLPAGQGWA